MRTIYCNTCGSVIGVVADNHPEDAPTGPEYCSAHHPEEKFKVVDPPQVRFNVAVVDKK